VDNFVFVAMFSTYFLYEFLIFLFDIGGRVFAAWRQQPFQA